MTTATRLSPSQRRLLEKAAKESKGRAWCVPENTAAALSRRGLVTLSYRTIARLIATDVTITDKGREALR